jgi:hypothetical protein
MSLQPVHGTVQLNGRARNCSPVPALPSYIEWFMGLERDMFVRKNNDIITKNNEHITQFFGTTLAVMHIRIVE